MANGKVSAPSGYDDISVYQSENHTKILLSIYTNNLKESSLSTDLQNWSVHPIEIPRTEDFGYNAGFSNTVNGFIMAEPYRSTTFSRMRFYHSTNGINWNLQHNWSNSQTQIGSNFSNKVSTDGERASVMVRRRNIMYLKTTENGINWNRQFISNNSLDNREYGSSPVEGGFAYSARDDSNGTFGNYVNYLGNVTLGIRSNDFASNTNVGILVGNSGLIMTTLDNGVTWNTISSPVNSNFNKVYWLGGTNFSAITDDDEVLSSFNNGDTWFISNTGLSRIDSSTVTIIN